MQVKRPLTWIGFSAIFSLVFAAAFHTAALYCAAVCFVLSVIFLLLRKLVNKKFIYAATCCITAFVAILYYTFFVTVFVLPITEEYDGKVTEFSGMITTEPKTSGTTTSFTVRTDTINGEKKHINIRVSTSYTLPAEIYDKIECRAELSSMFEYGYGFASYYGARKVFLSTYINPYYDSEYTVYHNENRPFRSVFSDIRKAAADLFTKYLSYDEAAVCTAVVTGDRQYLSDEVYDSFRNLGISHILVVSGLHLSVVAGILRRICPKSVRGRYFSATVQLVGIFAFALITGLGFSVIRALIMTAISIGAEMFFEKADGIESLGIASLILCVCPLNIGDVGMLWSFACTLSLMLFADPIENRIRRLFEPYRSISFLSVPLSTSAAAMIGSLPFLIFYTGTISPYTIIVNTLLVPFTGLLIICAAFAAVLSMCGFAFAAYPLLFVAGITAKCFIAVAHWFEGLPYSSIRTDNSLVYIWFVISVMIIAAFGIMSRKTIRYAAIISLSVLIGIYSINAVITYDDVTLSVLDVGDGLAITLKKNDTLFLLDAAGEKYQYNQIKSELKAYDKVNCIFDTSYTGKEYSYYRRITRDFDINKIIVTSDYKYSTLYSYQRYCGADIICTADDIEEMAVADGVSITLIHTGDNVWQYLRINSHSVLICPPNSDYSLLPYEYRNVDYIIMSDMPENMELDIGTAVILSAYGENCDKLLDEVKDSSAVYATNGEGRIDMKFHGSGNIALSREYTGGVTKYA